MVSQILAGSTAPPPEGVRSGLTYKHASISYHSRGQHDESEDQDGSVDNLVDDLNRSQNLS